MSGACQAGDPPPVPALVLVAAVADNGVIGQGGGLPWRLKSDLRNFRAITMGKPVVMGRRTYLSIGKPLAGRTNIVVSRNRDFAAPGVMVAPSVEAALAAIRYAPKPLDIVLVRTGRDACYDRADYMLRGPAVSAEATRWPSRL